MHVYIDLLHFKGSHLFTGVPLGGARGVSQPEFPQYLAGSISATRYIIAFKCSQNVGHT